MIDESTKTITIGEFNTDNYDDDRQSAGYICERDELWGCPDDYFMVHYSFLFKVNIYKYIPILILTKLLQVSGKCYKVIESEMSHSESEMLCSSENAKMAEPNSFLESEFLEALISHKNSEKATDEKLKKIWLKMRKEVPTDSSFYDFPSGVSSSNLRNSGSGDCIFMSLDDSGKHLGK